MNIQTHAREPKCREVRAWQVKRNQRGVPINWRFTTEKVRIKLLRLYPKL